MIPGRKQIARGVGLVTVAHGVTIFSGTVRSIIIARLIGPDHFGIASTFVVTVMLLELISDLSIDKLLVQAKDGDDPVLQDTAHLINALRGLLLGAVIFLLGGEVATLFDAQEASMSYRLLGLVPIVRGFMHLDVRRMQRHFRFKGVAITDASGSIASVAAAVGLAWLIDDYNIALIAVAAQTVVSVAVSHALATRPYRWHFSRTFFRRVMAFGAPLMLNGLLMWLGMQGDRFIIGAYISTAELGVYTAACTILIMPSTAVMTIGGRVGLPYLSPDHDQPEILSARVGMLAAVYAAVITVSYLPISVFLPRLVSIAFGEAYSISSGAAVLLTLAFAARTCRALPILIALSIGRTGTILSGNIVRGCLVPLLFVGALRYKSVEAVAAMLAVIEASSLVAMWAFVRARVGREARLAVSIAVSTAPVVLVASGLLVAGPVSDMNIYLLVIITALVTATAAAVPAISMSGPRRAMLGVSRDVLSRIGAYGAATAPVPPPIDERSDTA